MSEKEIDYYLVVGRFGGYNRKQKYTTIGRALEGCKYKYGTNAKIYGIKNNNIVAEYDAYRGHKKEDIEDKGELELL